MSYRLYTFTVALLEELHLAILIYEDIKFLNSILIPNQKKNLNPFLLSSQLSLLTTFIIIAQQVCIIILLTLMFHKWQIGRPQIHACFQQKTHMHCSLHHRQFALKATSPGWRYFGVNSTLNFPEAKFIRTIWCSSFNSNRIES